MDPLRPPSLHRGKHCRRRSGRDVGRPAYGVGNDDRARILFPSSGAPVIFIFLLYKGNSDGARDGYFLCVEGKRRERHQTAARITGPNLRALLRISFSSKFFL